MTTHCYPVQKYSLLINGKSVSYHYNARVEIKEQEKRMYFRGSNGENQQVFELNDKLMIWSKESFLYIKYKSLVGFQRFEIEFIDEFHSLSVVAILSGFGLKTKSIGRNMKDSADSTNVSQVPVLSLQTTLDACANSPQFLPDRDTQYVPSESSPSFISPDMNMNTFSQWKPSIKLTDSDITDLLNLTLPKGTPDLVNCNVIGKKKDGSIVEYLVSGEHDHWVKLCEMSTDEKYLAEAYEREENQDILPHDFDLERISDQVLLQWVQSFSQTAEFTSMCEAITKDPLIP